MNIGDTVGIRSFDYDIAVIRVAVIKKISTRFTYDMGEPYLVFVLDTGHEFDTETMRAATPPYEYYITKI
jgi:hypothetical protein